MSALEYGTWVAKLAYEASEPSSRSGIDRSEAQQAMLRLTKCRNVACTPHTSLPARVQDATRFVLDGPGPVDGNGTDAPVYQREDD